MCYQEAMEPLVLIGMLGVIIVWRLRGRHKNFNKKVENVGVPADNFPKLSTKQHHFQDNKLHPENTLDTPDLAPTIPVKTSLKTGFRTVDGYARSMEPSTAKRSVTEVSPGIPNLEIIEHSGNHYPSLTINGFDEVLPSSSSTLAKFGVWIIPIRGQAFYDQPKLVVGQRLIPVPEPENIHDSHATYLTTEHGQKIGYVNRGTAKKIKKLVDAKVCLSAVVVSEQQGGDDFGCSVLLGKENVVKAILARHNV